MRRNEEIDRIEYRKEGRKEGGKGWYVERRALHRRAIMLSQHDSQSIHPSVCPTDGHTDRHPSFEW